MCASGRFGGNSSFVRAAVIHNYNPSGQNSKANGRWSPAAKVVNASTYSVPTTFSMDALVFDRRDPRIDTGRFSLHVHAEAPVLSLLFCASSRYGGMQPHGEEFPRRQAWYQARCSHTVA